MKPRQDPYLLARQKVFNVGKEDAALITAIECQKMTSPSLTESRYFVMVTTPGRLYQFIGNIPASTEAPVFHHVFTKYEDVPGHFLELPGEFGYSQLRFFHKKYKEVPRTFAWMTGPGIFTGKVDEGGTLEDSVIADTKLIDYPSAENIRPKAIVLTEFHVLVLFHDCLKALCILNEQLIFQDIFSEKHGNMRGMWKDPVKGTIWAYSEQAVFKYKVIREDRDVWQMYLDKEEFNLAKKYCKNNPANLDRVLTKQAEYFYSIDSYQKSAEIYAQTHNSFEEITLKFIKLQQKDALMTFLIRKLHGLRAQDKTQVTMLVTWLIEIYLNQLGTLKESGQGGISKEFQNLQEEFRNFLRQPRVKECVNINRNTVYELIASHGDVEDMIYFAVLMKDYERVIAHHLQHENYMNALEILSKQLDVELFYKFSPVLMQNIPQRTVTAWIQRGADLDPKRLIPALVHYDSRQHSTQGSEAIRYLEHCIQHFNTKDQAIHNYLLSLYAQLQPDQLMTYLVLQGQDADSVCYDLKYALRLCAEHKHKKACVHIYSTMGLYEEAVDLALQVDVKLAKENADRPEDDEELKKKLWLRIARHVVEEEKDIKGAMDFLHEFKLLKIEDILPFFPDFVTIDHFKDAICTSLQEYNQHIETLKEQMDYATENAKEIRGEIQAFRNKYAFVKGSDKCSSCSYPLMTRGFYVFPCTHRFHNDCLVSEVVPHLSRSQRVRVAELQRRIESHDVSPTYAVAAAVGGAIGGQRGIQALKEELDDLISAECVYCGDVMIRSVDKPFIAPEEEDSMINSWL